MSRTKEEKEVKKVTVDEMITLMKVLSDSALERMTTNNDLAVEIFETSRPATRCGLWKRSETHYDLYIGFETPLYKLSEVRKHLTYVDDKKMSKKEIMFKFVGKDAWKRTNLFITSLQAKAEKEAEKATTIEVNESESDAV